MFDKTLKVIFISLFTAMLIVPLVTINLKKDAISTAENRKLSQFPDFYDDQGNRNINFNNQFETWINDNIGFRSNMVIANAKIQYYLFDVLSNNTDMYLGPKGEFNYATEEMLIDYQHLNLKSGEALNFLAEGFQCASDYLENRNIQMYYFQCWDKHSIYPEYFPKTVIQYGKFSKTDSIVKTLTDQTNVCVVSPKSELIAGKKRYDTYSKWGDATHWTPRGAFIGYQKLMKVLNDNNHGKYKILQEDNYEIAEKDQGLTLFGGIHKECILEEFEIKNPQAYMTNEKLSLYADDKRHKFYTNDSVNNRDCVLVLGDSYFNNFIVDDIAESFYETLIIWGDYCDDFVNIIDTYEPDIVIIENAERCDRTEYFAKMALSIKDVKEE